VQGKEREKRSKRDPAGAEARDATTTKDRRLENKDPIKHQNEVKREMIRFRRESRWNGTVLGKGNGESMPLFSRWKIYLTVCPREGGKF